MLMEEECTVHLLHPLGCSFSQCSSGKGGGRLFVSSVSSCTSVSNCTFTSCKSQWGAAAWIEKSNTTGSGCTGSISSGMVHDCSFTTCTSNSTTLSGGTFSFWNNTALSAHSCSFTSNTGECGAGSRYLHNTLRRRGCMPVCSSTTQLSLLDTMSISSLKTILVFQPLCLMITVILSLTRRIESLMITV